MEWVAVVLGVLLLGAIGVAVWLFLDRAEKTRQLAESRVLRKLAVLDQQRADAMAATEVPSRRIVALDEEIDALRKEAVHVREDTARMSSRELADAFNELIKRLPVWLLLGASLWAAPAHAQNVVPLDHEGERGVWMPEEDAVRILRTAQLSVNYERQIRLLNERLALSDEVIGHLREAANIAHEAQEAAQLLAFGSEERAIKAENRASSPWGRVLWALVGGVLGAAIAVVVFAFTAGGG